MKIAQYKAVDCRDPIMLEATNYIESSPHYIRCSEIIDVEFPPLPREAVVAAEVKDLDKLHVEYQGKLDALERRRAELCAIGYDAVTT